MLQVRKLLFIIGLTALSFAGAAQPAPNLAAREKPKPAATGGGVRISAEDCARAVAHVPDADVAYRPGVDVQGRAVAPADLGPPQLEAPPSVSFMISVDLARRFGLPQGPAGGLAAELPLGIITVEGNRVLFNGQPLNREDTAALQAACRRSRP
jgi:hypothetical protein